MNAPEAVKHAAHMAANEVLIEWLESIAEDPQAVLDGDELGSTYQNVLSAADMSDADARRMLGELAPWDPGGAGSTVERFEAALFKAGVDIARALIALACDLEGVSDAAKPFAAELQPLVDVLKEALEEGSFDEESLDLHALIWS
jgi:hypothetical protein